MMAAFHYYVCLICFLLSLSPVLVNAASCSGTANEGNLQLAGSVPNRAGYRYLQVCHMQNWRYVCGSEFDHSIDREVVLQQLNCNTGDTIASFKNTGNNGYELDDCPCFGVEKMLINCPRYFKLQQKSCNWKVSVYCGTGTVTRQCLNGELMKSNTNILYLCVSGHWTKLCSNLWGNSQESVACRQLSQKTLTQYDAYSSDEYFKNYIHCTGQEEKITDCRFTSVEDNDCTKTPVKLMCKKVETPENIVLTSITSSSVEANWTQPSSADSVWQYYTNHTITCTSTHGVYTATQHVNVSAAVNESMHTIITGLMVNTSYNCCVSVYSELGRSEDVCGSVITDNNTDSMQIIIISTIVPSCSVASDSGTVQAGFSTQVSVYIRTKPTSDSVMTRSTSAMTKPTSVMTDAQCEANSSTLPWVAGIIIGAVLSAVILLTVIVAVYLWRKKAQSQYKMSDSSTERRVSLTQTNQCYSSVQEPQPYEEFQTNELDNQPAADGVYSYADHTVNANVYDSVPQSNENPKEDTTMPVVDNTALYSMGKHDNGAYSQHNCMIERNMC